MSVFKCGFSSSVFVPAARNPSWVAARLLVDAGVHQVVTAVRLRRCLHSLLGVLRVLVNAVLPPLAHDRAGVVLRLPLGVLEEGVEDHAARGVRHTTGHRAADRAGDERRADADTRTDASRDGVLPLRHGLLVLLVGFLGFAGDRLLAAHGQGAGHLARSVGDLKDGELRVLRVDLVGRQVRVHVVVDDRDFPAEAFRPVRASRR
ncbi:hypothetical protein ACPCUK_02330 [Streptomyces arboris]|uniref:hypothetical protein n=1 Tax=Streptomyces arboris TaxID=2600619 RepID=UPI003C2E3870